MIWDASHPFVQWWINESRWHDKATEDWKASLASAEAHIAIEAWNAAVRECIGEHPDCLLHMLVPEAK